MKWYACLRRDANTETGVRLYLYSPHTVRNPAQFFADLPWWIESHEGETAEAFRKRADKEAEQWYIAMWNRGLNRMGKASTG